MSSRRSKWGESILPNWPGIGSSWLYSGTYATYQTCLPAGPVLVSRESNLPCSPCQLDGLTHCSMELLFHISLVVIVALGVRLALEMLGQPKEMAEPAAMGVILAVVAVVLYSTWVYSMMELITFVFSLTMVTAFLIGFWFYVLQPLAENAQTNHFQGLSLAGWNIRWDYLSIFLLAFPVFLLILTYNHFAGLFDFAVGRMVPLVVLGFIYFHAIVKRW